MKKFISGLIVGLMLSSTVVFAANQDISAVLTNFNFVVNGQAKTVSTQPIVYNGTSYLPVREISTMLGYTVDYNNTSRTISLSNRAQPESNDTSASSNISSRPSIPDPIHANIGEEFTLGDTIIKLNRIDYQTRYNEFSSGDDIFAVINFDIYTTSEPNDDFTWASISFVDNISVNGKTLRTPSTTGASSKIYPNEHRVVDVLETIPDGSKVESVTFRDPVGYATAIVSAK